MYFSVIIWYKDNSRCCLCIFHTLKALVYALHFHRQGVHEEFLEVANRSIFSHTRFVDQHEG